MDLFLRQCLVFSTKEVSNASFRLYSVIKGIFMLYTVIVVLLVLWLIGLIGNIGGGLIHLLLVVAVVVFIYNLIAGRRRGGV